MSGPALRIDGRLVTSQAFYAAACDPARSVVVEACAGSGKTWMLVARMLRALLEGAEPHELLAITFTRAAAGEMRDRLAEWVAQWAAPRSTHEERVAALVTRGLDASRAEALAPRLGELQGRLLAHGRPVAIRTFHAWFSQLLRTAPIDLLEGLGMQPDMTLVEGIDEHRPAVMRAFHGAVLRDPQLAADFQVLTATRGRTQLGKWLLAGWHKRIEFELADAAGVLETSVPPAAALWPELAACDDPCEQLLQPPWSSRLRDLAASLARGKVASQRASAGLTESLEVPHGRARFDIAWSALHTAVDEPRKHLTASSVLDETLHALAHLRAQSMQHDAHVEHLRMTRLVRALLAEFAAYKRARGLADMADLERCALALLRDGELAGWVQERLDARVRHLFIDEFQDTSPLQWHALHAWLSGYAGAGGGASGQRPPSVFIVGDPKQSLYRFRGAEPRVFTEATRFVVEGLGGQVLACDHTRRNAPALIEALNSVFAAAQEEGLYAGFRAHTTEVATAHGDAVRALERVERGPRSQGGGAAAPVWRDTLLEARELPETLLREQEAGFVARGVAALLSEPMPGRIHVLARKRESLRFAADALQAAHIAHGRVEETPLMETAEAQDLVAVLDVLASPQHGLSLARALKSPLFGASDDDLMAIADGTRSAAGWSHALQSLAAPSAALQRARRLLAAWADAARRLPPHDLLDRVVHEGELKERTLAAVPPEQRQAALDAIDAVLGQALQLDGARYATPYGFVRALRRRAIKAPVPVRDDALRLLTIHGAKGLEADAVFLMDTDPEAPQAETVTLLVEWPVESEHPLRCAFVYSETRCPPSLAGLLETERAGRGRESLNALYVAMTRARRQLVVSSTAPLAPTRNGPSWWARLATVAMPWSPGAQRPAHVANRAPPAMLQQPPDWHRAPAFQPHGEDSASTADRDDAETARIGRAVHRVLEWAADRPHAADPLPRFATAAALEFGADATTVERRARAIFESPTCRPFLSGPGLRWSGNEVPIAHDGELLRIDRLVQLAHPSERTEPAPRQSSLFNDASDEDEGTVNAADVSTWWVLDYKLHHAPAALEAYREQLLRYAVAVERGVSAGARVRCAFITGRGEVVEVPRSTAKATESVLSER